MTRPVQLPPLSCPEQRGSTWGTGLVLIRTFNDYLKKIFHDCVTQISIFSKD